MIDFKNIGPHTTLASMKTLLAEIKEEAEVEIEGEEESYSNLTKDQVKRIEDLESGIDQMADYLNRIQSSIDRAYLPVLKETVTSGVKNYKSAYDCTMFYTKEWFSNVYMSIDGKVELARFIYETVYPFCKSNLDTLRMIKDRESDIVLYISYPRER
jgi:hypothetical protein